MDAAVKKITAPQERMVKLLQAKDKKATLLEMAGGWKGATAQGRRAQHSVSMRHVLAAV